MHACIYIYIYNSEIPLTGLVTTTVKLVLSNPSNFTMAGQHPSAQPLRCFQLSPAEFSNGAPVETHFWGGRLLEILPLKFHTKSMFLIILIPILWSLPDTFNILNQLP